MNLDDFEDEIDSPTILSRGLSYYRGRSVLSLEMVEPNHYKADVAGTQLYEVTLTLDDDREVEDMYCTCPYDWGEYCKHEVAVLYALRHQLNSAHHVMVERPKEVDLEALLERKSKKELLSFLLAYAKKKPDVASALVAAFPSPDDGVNLTNLGIEFRLACENGIESTVEEDEYGWDEDEDDWQLTTALRQKIAELLMMAQVAIATGNIRYGGSIASMIVHEMSILDEYEGETLTEEIEVVLMQVAALFDEVTLNADDGSWLFTQFLTAAKNYEGPPQAVLLRLCIKFAETESDQEGLKNYLVALASEEPDTEGDGNLPALKLQHSLLLKQDKGEEALSFALDNISYEGMRKIAFNHALESKDYVLAEKLAKENEASPYRTYGAIDWGALLFKVYQEGRNTIQMRSLAKEFLLHDDLSYYPILKASYDQNEWESVLDDLLDEMQARSEAIEASLYRKNPYPEVLKGEGKLERLLTYIQKNPRLVQSYQDVLVPHHKDEVFALYRQIILDDGEVASSRNEYKALASWLRELVSIGGGVVVEECLQALAPRYMKRPAMRDEIQRVGLL